MIFVRLQTCFAHRVDTCFLNNSALTGPFRRRFRLQDAVT